MLFPVYMVMDEYVLYNDKFKNVKILKFVGHWL